MRPSGFDRMVMGASDGPQLYRVFEPRWWQVWRWLWWLTFARRRARGKVTITTGDGGQVEVRVTAEVGIFLPRVPRA